MRCRGASPDTFPGVFSQSGEEERLTLSNFVAKVRRHSSSAAADKNKAAREKMARKKGSLDMVSRWMPACSLHLLFQAPLTWNSVSQSADTQTKRGTLRDFFRGNRGSLTKPPDELSITLPSNPMYRGRSDDDASTARSDSVTPYQDADDDGKSMRSSESESLKSPPARTMQVPQRRRSSNSTAKLFGALPTSVTSNDSSEQPDALLSPSSQLTDDEILAPITQRLLGGIAASNRRVSMIIAQNLSDSESEDGDDLPGYVPKFSATDDADMCQSSSYVPGFSAYDGPSSSSSQFTATDEPLPRLSDASTSGRSRGRRSGISLVDPAALKALEAGADDGP